jgi:hypothetical protein
MDAYLAYQVSSVQRVCGCVSGFRWNTPLFLEQKNTKFFGVYCLRLFWRSCAHNDYAHRSLRTQRQQPLFRNNTAINTCVTTHKQLRMCCLIRSRRSFLIDNSPIKESSSYTTIINLRNSERSSYSKLTPL